MRTLPDNPQTSGGVNALTIALCTSACASGGYVLAGAEFAGECYCGNQLGAGAVLAPYSDCGMACNGNSSEFCGGSNRMNVYSTLGWKNTGCYTGNTSDPTLLNQITPVPTANMSIEACTGGSQVAGTKGYSLAALFNGETCYCGNVVANKNTPAADGLAGCNMPCNGNATETCGGPNRMDVYWYRGAVPSVGATSSSTIVVKSSKYIRRSHEMDD